MCYRGANHQKDFVGGLNFKLKEIEDIYLRNGRTYKLIKSTQCGIKFERRADSVNRRVFKNYCSKQCMGMVQSIDRKGKPILALRTGKELKCKFCGEEYYEKNSKIARGSRYCSRKCFNKDRVNLSIAKGFIGSANNSGEKNGRYKHGNRTGGNITKAKLRKMGYR